MTTYEIQKSISSDLDRASQRAEICDLTGATRKQCWYLAKLLSDQSKDAAWIGCECTQTNARLTKRQASHYISDMLAA